MSENSPFFSVIMPIYNQSRYLPKALESIIAQTFSEWELIIIDDGSTDQSPEIIEHFCAKHPRMRSFRQENQGAGAARNRGISRARGLWLCYLDSDDVWFPETLEKYHNCIEANPSARFVYGFRHRVDQEGNVNYLEGKYQDAPTGPYELFHECFLSPLRVCHTKDLVKQVGGYDEALPLCEDYDLFLRMSMHTEFRPIAAATGLRRRHEANLSSQTGFSLLVQAGVLMRFVEQYGGERVLDENKIDKRLGKVFYAAGREYFHTRHYRRCIAAMQKGRHYSLPIKGRGLQMLARLLIAFDVDDKCAWPIPLGTPRWNIDKIS